MSNLPDAADEGRWSEASISRRAIMTAAGASALTAGRACAESPGTATPANSLVVYFTRSGNTRVIAAGIARALGAPLAEISPVRP